MFSKICFALVSLLLFFSKIQSSCAQNTTPNYGNEYIFCLLENYIASNRVVFNINLEKTPSRIKIVSGIQVFDNFIYRKDTQFVFNTTTTPTAAFFSPNKSVAITSSESMGLSVLNSSQNSTDISFITPTNLIPKNPIYYINTYRGEQNLSLSNSSLFSIVGLENNCQISILSNANSKTGLSKGVEFKITLSKGQVYRTQSLDSQSFAGTKIWVNNGCKKIAVFEGAQCSFVEYNNSNCRGCDHLYAQSTPVQFLGKNYTTIPFQNNQQGYIYQVVASQNGSDIFEDGLLIATLNEGESLRVKNLANLSVCVSSNHPISVSQLMKSGGCNGHISNLGNPSLMTLTPDNQTIKNVGFSFFTTNNIAPTTIAASEFYLGLVAPLNNVSSILLNGLKIDSSAFIIKCNKKVGSIKLNANTAYSIQSNTGFVGYIYANGKDESYASSISKGISNSQLAFIINNDVTETCDSFYSFSFNAQSASNAIFKWDFGDGTFANGSSVSKIYNKVGQFKASLTASYPNNLNCSEDTLSKTITINKRPYFDLGKDTTLCFGEELIIKPNTPIGAQYLWNNGTSAKQISVINKQAISLRLTNASKCEFSDTIIVDFKSCDSNYFLVPNVFTPALQISGGILGDNLNDEFEAKMDGYDELQGFIYNRWGTLVYQFTKPKDAFWNGYLQNDISKPCPSGTYYYLYYFKNSKTGFTNKTNGVVTLIR